MGVYADLGDDQQMFILILAIYIILIIDKRIVIKIPNTSIKPEMAKDMDYYNLHYLCTNVRSLTLYAMKNTSIVN